MLFAGFDVSTQGCKLVVIDLRNDAVVHVDALRYDDDLPEYGTRDGALPGLGEGVSESDPTMWTDAVEILLGRLGDADLDATQIRCIDVSGQMHGLVALDRTGALARPRAKLWNDVSTAEECAVLTAAVGGAAAMIATVGNSQRPGYTASKVLHMVRHEPETWRRTARLLVVHDWINRYLTGGIEVMEPGDASGTAMWNPVTSSWAQPVLAAIGDDVAAKLPPVVPVDATIGALDPGLAFRYGLSASCRIGPGSGDNMFGAVGTGTIGPGSVTVSLGTSGTAAVCTDGPWSDPAGEIASYRDATGRFLLLLCVSNMANGYNALRREFALDHDDVPALLAQTPAGNLGRVLVPWYEGERTPDLPDAAPVYFGFGADDFVPAVLARAVLEGHVHSLCSGFRGLPVEAGELRVTGGLARSSAWCQMLADIFDVDAVPVRGEGAALGAALHAAWIWSRESGSPIELAELVERFVVLEEDRRARPEPSRRAAYALQRRLYCAVADRTRGLEADEPGPLHEALRAVDV